MTKSRKIISLILAVVLLVPVLMLGGTASAMKHPGRIDGVDYSRIRENKDLSIEVQFTLGTTQFKGELINGSTLSNDEIDKIIDGVMKQMNMTCGKLGYSKAVIEKAKHLKGFDPAMALRIGLNIAGFGTVTDIYDMYQGQKEVPAGLAGIVVGELSGQAVNLLTGKKWADIVLNAFLATKDIAAEWTRLEQEKEIAEQALERELLLDLFYKECNERLKKAEKERGGSQWKLKANDSKYKQKTLFGIEVGQIQWLRVDMERVDSFGDDSPTNWSGVYEGNIVLQIWHDLDSFDQNFPNIFANSNPIFQRLQTIYRLRPQSAKEKSSLTKIITMNVAQVYIDKRNAIGTTLTKNIPLAGAEDVSAFNLAHKVTFALGIRPWNDGELHISGTGGSYEAHCTMSEDCSGTMLEGNRYPAIMWNSHDTEAYDTLVAPMGVGWTHRPLVSNGKISVGCPALADYQIYNDLRDNMITLWIKDIEKVVRQ